MSTPKPHTAPPHGAEQVTLTLCRTSVRRTVQEDWLTAIEDALPHVRAALRTPTHELHAQTALRPAARAQRVSRRADVYLSRHAEHVHAVRADTVIPERLPSVRRDDSTDTYENRFLNTLVRRLHAFVAQRYACLTAQTAQSERTTLHVSLCLPDGETATWDCTLSADVTPPPEEDAWCARVERLHRATAAFCRHALIVRMDTQTVTPPLLPTNAMRQNAALRRCVALFHFLEQYEGLGCRVTLEERTEQPDAHDMRELYPLLMPQLALMRRLHAAQGRADAQRTVRQLSPALHTAHEDGTAAAFDVRTTELRRVFPAPVPDDPYRQLTADERGVCRALQTALEADAALRRAAAARPHACATAARAVIHLDTLCRHFPSGARITPALLVEQGLLHAQTQHVKILSRGELRKVLHITADAFSSDARRHIEQAGGTATVRRPSRPKGEPSC